ncbi:phosphoribosylanthranilate isomerase [Segetibacter sp. 3557_3]|uniref:phosphoribosylanthranilate isomerase n=1 Tax=Segetibacter sp. 3557_3 TaxID=2547429 RepID=UPI00105897B3|nr:phosphoribosylanthranilate isomerase [Segetibacter sp. 3557_3]TDH27848.1 phosphoribosylanthranilate isomerase [Segetibacter sp. 3557_3]
METIIPAGQTPPVERRSLRMKVCGMTSLDQLHELGDMGVQFAGMIFYHKSPRFVMRHLKGYEVKKAKLKVFKIGVFVNASYDEIMNHVDNFGLDMVQLHGDETPRFCETVSNYVAVIKAFRLTDDDHIAWKIRNYMDVADMFMFDTEGSGYGGTGKKFNWNVLRGERIDKPFFLSGGIQPDDGINLKEFARESVAKDLFAVDINSRFEVAPGVKDMQLVKSFASTII